MGGSLSYTYLGLNSSTGNYRYQVRIELFRLCDAGSSLLPIDMNLGVYQDDPLNPNGNKLLVLNTTLPIILQQAITPPNANDSCTFAPNVCVEEGVYEDIVELPPSTLGYHFISDRCCRNNNILNLANPGNAGQAYYAYAPPPTTVNNTPVFAVAPVPFICNTDTASVLNQAFDPDGDSLAYSFVTPYNGISSNMNPNPNPPVNYQWTIPNVGYAGTYSLATPFGPGGYAAIDATTGLSYYYAPNQGFYVVAVEIREYRNGQLIGISRRDIQIIVISCPVNPAPALSASTAQTSFIIEEGDTLCFNTTFNDANGDSIFITHTGNIFNGSITNPPAVFTDASGLATATGQFCWATACGQNSTTPYQFSVIVNDNGCPAKTTNIVYSITVNTVPKPIPISGPDSLCADNITGITYFVPHQNNYTTTWVVNNGVILGSATGDSVTVTFNGPGIAQVGAIAVNRNGCPSDTLFYDVVISPVPTAAAGPDKTICSNSSTTVGTAAVPGLAYAWTPATGLSSSTSAQPTVTLTNTGISPQTFTYILAVTSNECTDYDTVQVTVNPRPAPSAGADQAVCSGNTVQIGVNPVAGTTYSWTPPTGLSSTTIANPVVTLTNSGSSPLTQTYIVTAQNVFNCVTTDSVTVTINAVPVSNAGSDSVYCSGTPYQIGTTSTSGYAYSWNPATGLSSATLSNPTVTHLNVSGQNDTLLFVVTTSLATCTSTDTVQVVVKPVPVSNAGNDQLLCSGNTLAIGTSPTPGYTYSWSPATGLSSTSISNPVVTLTNTGSATVTYTYVVVTDLNGCLSTDSVTITSSPVPTAIAGADTSYCSGNSITIGSSSQSNYTYSWTPATGLSNTTISNPVVNYVNATGNPVTLTYILNTNLFGCTDSDTILVTVNPTPISNAGNDVTLCGSDTINLGGPSTAGYVYSWTPATGLSNTTVANPVLITNNAGGSQQVITYIVTTTLNNCSSTDSVTVTINPDPVVTAVANPSVICSGQSTQLTAGGATTYSWALATSPGTIISTNASFSVSPTTTTTYIVNGSFSTSCNSNNTVTVTVNPLPAVQIAAANDTICNGDSITLNASGAANYLWTTGGNTIGSGSAITVFPNNTTTYVLTGTDGNSCQNSDSITITVNPTPTVTAISGNTSVCPGVTGVSYSVVNPDPNYIYVWNVSNGTITSGQNTSAIVVDWSVTPGTGTVSVIAFNTFNCESSPVSLNVTINVLLTPVAPTGPTTFCANDATGTYTTLNTNGSTYNWFAQGGTVTSGNGTNSVNVIWTTTGPATVALWYQETSITTVDTCFGTSDTLYVTLNPAPITGAINGPAGICVSDTGTFSVTNTAGSSYNWTITGGNVVSGNGTNSITANWNGSGNAVVTVIETNSFGCSDTVSYNVTVNTLPNVSAGTDTEVCLGQGVTLNASGGVNYSWSPSTGLSNPNVFNPVASPSSSTVYAVLVTDANGCKNTDSVLVTVNPLPVITLTPNSSICIGSNIQLNAGGGSSYQWSPASSLDNAGISNPVASPSATTTYTVIVTDQNTCVDSANVTIIVNPLPTITAMGDTTICEGTGVTLNANGGVTYVWSPATTLNNPNIQNPVATPAVPTTYTVTGTDGNGCSNTDEVTINLNIVPDASFIVIDGELTELTCNGYTAKLQNTSTNALLYEWHLPGGTISSEENPELPLNLSGVNVIMLVATNNMCNDTAIVNYESTAISKLFKNIPNVFTPNNDGKNDCFNLGDNIDLKNCSSWQVFNRWGKKVFSSSAEQPCWNGKKNNTGDELSPGAYYLVLTIAGKTYQGSINLIR